MSSHEIPVPVRAKFFTTGTKVLFGIMCLGLASLVYRFIGGLGAVTNLDNGYGWGIWIAIDVACGVALAAGGFTTAALAEIFQKEKRDFKSREGKVSCNHSPRPVDGHARVHLCRPGSAGGPGTLL